MHRVGIIANPARPVVAGLIPELVRMVTSRSGKPTLAADLAATAGEAVARRECVVVDSDERAVEDVDWVIAIGGDGTLLKTARLVGASGTPILGINSGKLGFMMQTTPGDLDDALERVFDGRYTLDKRLVLQGRIANGSFSALNDIVIDKGAICRVIELGIYINDEYVNDVMADGLIVSTPTGSTAYSLAAGGPILAPDMEAIVVSPICPHTLSNRAMVLAARDRIRIEVRADHPDLLLTVDGQENVVIQPGNTVELYRADHTIHLIRFTDRSFYDVLRTKLKWGER
ncbi:MAG: NAD(+) kinase [Gemmatimonadetes bacterium]|nr:NAD(+) kinase [Gemmatimonadota bacterium]MYD25082.1 NAD(+) kinase [Gemmatimonadota bacterium]